MRARARSQVEFVVAQRRSLKPHRIQQGNIAATDSRHAQQPGSAWIGSRVEARSGDEVVPGTQDQRALRHLRAEPVEEGRKRLNVVKRPDRAVHVRRVQQLHNESRVRRLTAFGLSSDAGARWFAGRVAVPP